MSSALLLRFIFSRIWARDRYNLKKPSPSSASPAQLNVSMAGDHVLQPLAHNRVIVGDDRPNLGYPPGRESKQARSAARPFRFRRADQCRDCRRHSSRVCLMPSSPSEPGLVTCSAWMPTPSSSTSRISCPESTRQPTTTAVAFEWRSTPPRCASSPRRRGRRSRRSSRAFCVALR